MSIAGGVSILLLIMLLVPAVAGIVLIVLSRRGSGRGYPACGGCGYDVSGSVGEATRCPECGEEFTKVGIRPPEGRRRPVMMGAGIALVALVVTCFGGMFMITISRGSVSAAPPPTATAAPAPAPTAVDPMEPVPGPAAAAEPAPPAADPDLR